MRIVTIADAVAVMDYLHKRKLLCTKCGSRLAKWKQQYDKTFCHECKPPQGTYEPYTVPNELEGRIVGALEEWVAFNAAVNAGGKDGPGATGSTGQ